MKTHWPAHAGHFYNCSNGHIFVITEVREWHRRELMVTNVLIWMQCGSAMERLRCPECGAAIGGSSQRIDPSNTRNEFEALAREAGAGRTQWGRPW